MAEVERGVRACNRAVIGLIYDEICPALDYDTTWCYEVAHKIQHGVIEVTQKIQHCVIHYTKCSRHVHCVLEVAAACVLCMPLS